jgi:hypothetical protein
VVSRKVTPLVQRGQVCQARRVRRVRCTEIEDEAEALQIPSQVLEGRVAVVELPVGDELGLDQRLERCSQFRHDDLGGLRVEVAAEPLEVCAEQEDVPAQVLLDQVGLRRREHQARSTLRVHGGQTRHSVVLPAQQRSGRHGVSSAMFQVAS